MPIYNEESSILSGPGGWVVMAEPWIGPGSPDGMQFNLGGYKLLPKYQHPICPELSSGDFKGSIEGRIIGTTLLIFIFL